MSVKKSSLAVLAVLGASTLIAPAANASGFIVVDPAFHVPPPAPVITPTTVTPSVTPVRPGDRTPRPTSPVLHGRVTTGLSLDKQEITVDIDNNVAKTYIKQTFKNDTDRNLAGTYLFPLPQDAVFSSFSLHIDGKPVEGKILAAAEARTQYEQIVRSMVDPGLLEYADYKTVRARIFPIPAHGSKTVELEYTQLVKADGGMFRYKFPLKSAQCEAVDETKINLKLKSKEELRTIWSPTHIITTDRKEGGHMAVVTFDDKGDQVNEKDFSVYYTISDKELSTSLLTHKRSDEDGYFMMTLNPPFAAKQVIAKDIVLVADTSGSMNGEKMEQSKKALKYVVDSLNEGDRFSLVQFNTDAEAFPGGLLDATADNKKKAKQFIDELEPRGGTNIGEALAIGLETLNAKEAGARPAYLVLMTDGQPTVGVTEMADLIKSVKPKRDVRLFDFGVGYDVNTQLLNKLAEEHHGTAQYVEPDENLENVLSSFYAKIKSPVLSDVKLAYEGIEVKDVYPKSVKDIFAGTPVMLIGRYKAGAEAKVNLSGTVNGAAKTYSFPLAFAAQETGSTYLPRMWAMRRIGYLTEVAKANDENQEVVDEIVELSKRYGIISAYTSFLVTDPNEPNSFRMARTGRPLAAQVRGPALMRGNADRNMFQVAPTVLDERHFTSGRAERRQRTSPTTAGSKNLAYFNFSSKQRAAIGGLVPPPPAMTLSTNASVAPGAFGSRNGLPSTSLDSFVAGAGGSGDHIFGDEGSRGLPAVSWGRSVHSPGDNHYRVAKESTYSRKSANSGFKGVVGTSGHASHVPDALGGDAFEDDASATRAEEAKKSFAKALASAKPAGEQAVLMQKALNNLKSSEAIARADADGGVKVIGDKTFYMVNGFWVDSSFEKIKDPKPDEIEFGSKKYFELVKTESGITQYLGAGQQVIVVFNGRCYKIVAPAANMG